MRLIGSLFFLAAVSNAGNAQFRSLSLSGGSGFACGLTSAGRVYCWGDNKEGQLGIGRLGGHRASPTRVALSRPVQALTIGSDYACALQNGKPLCWGTNARGELGDSSHVDARATPRPVKGDLRFRSLSAGDGFTCGISTSGDAYCWGVTVNGQLGAGIKSDSTQGAHRVSGDHRFRMLRAGPESTVCGITQDSVAYCWGNLASDTAGPISDVPVRVAGRLSFREVSVGSAYVCGLTTDSLAYCWGYEGEGGLGDGHPLPRTTSRRYASTPSPVVGGLRFTTLSAGFRTTCALDTKGRAYCWGWNEDGQVGDGTTTNRTAPTPVSGEYVFREVHAGGGTSCGITVGGQTMCWGRGAKGELGNGMTQQRSLRPVRVIDPVP